MRWSTAPLGGRVRLRWKQTGSDTVFPTGALSDGTLRFVCMATLLPQPDPPALLVLDEPEPDAPAACPAYSKVVDGPGALRGAWLGRLAASP
ncbi:AAA family ATPase [Streptomyces sp. TRM 70361]|uniref:AAA family ATPase n=1 Tax=Streptomyces sp. TRM 70361 TaxID=3116553 RepID=UPI002E7BC6CA|nr:AAA family ATPase [Streptomyces sp. TRM 70361]MEE1938452.1 AAA family ATPase [Streptomyces sp. TRM 70361]